MSFNDVFYSDMNIMKVEYMKNTLFLLIENMEIKVFIIF